MQDFHTFGIYIHENCLILQSELKHYNNVYMKKLIISIMALSLLLCACEKEDTGLSVTIGGLKYYLYHGNMAIIDYSDTYNSLEGELTIPETVDYQEESYTVEGMVCNAFRFCTGLTKVRIPKTIDHVVFHALGGDGNGAISPYEMNLFAGCTALESIEVDNANSILSSVDGVLFSKDRTKFYAYPAGAKRESYMIPEGTKYIYNNAFYSCKSLQILDVPESVTWLGADVFSNTHLKAIIFRFRETSFIDLYEETFKGMNAGTIIYVQQSEVEKFKKVYSGKVLPLDSIQE